MELEKLLATQKQKNKLASFIFSGRCFPNCKSRPQIPSRRGRFLQDLRLWINIDVSNQLRNQLPTSSIMPDKKSNETAIRKLTRIGKKSIGLTLPIDEVRNLGWREKQKVVVKRVRGGLFIRDFKE